MPTDKTRRLTFSAMLLAVMLALSFMENQIPPLPGMPPGIKLGFANIAVMYTLLFMGTGYAVSLSALKSVFVFLTRGFTAFVLSFTGSLSAVIVMTVLLTLSRDKASYTRLSITGAFSHNIGQICAASVLTGTGMVFYYMPVLAISAVIMGMLTAGILKAVIPALKTVKDKLAPKGNR